MSPEINNIESNSAQMHKSEFEQVIRILEKTLSTQNIQDLRDINNKYPQYFISFKKIADYFKAYNNPLSEKSLLSDDIWSVTESFSWLLPAEQSKKKAEVSNLPIAEQIQYLENLKTNAEHLRQKICSITSISVASQSLGYITGAHITDDNKEALYQEKNKICDIDSKVSNIQEYQDLDQQIHNIATNYSAQTTEERKKKINKNIKTYCKNNEIDAILTQEKHEEITSRLYNIEVLDEFLYDLSKNLKKLQTKRVEELQNQLQQLKSTTLPLSSVKTPPTEIVVDPQPTLETKTETSEINAAESSSNADQQKINEASQPTLETKTETSAINAAESSSNADQQKINEASQPTLETKTETSAINAADASNNTNQQTVLNILLSKPVYMTALCILVNDLYNLLYASPENNLYQNTTTFPASNTTSFGNMSTTMPGTLDCPYIPTNSTHHFLFSNTSALSVSTSNTYPEYSNPFSPENTALYSLIWSIIENAANNITTNPLSPHTTALSLASNNFYPYCPHIATNMTIENPLFSKIAALATSALLHIKHTLPPAASNVTALSVVTAPARTLLPQIISPAVSTATNAVNKTINCLKGYCPAFLSNATTKAVNTVTNVANEAINSTAVSTATNAVNKTITCLKRYCPTFLSNTTTKAVSIVEHNNPTRLP